MAAKRICALAIASAGEAGHGKRGEHPGAGHGYPQQFAQIAGVFGKLQTSQTIINS